MATRKKIEATRRATQPTANGSFTPAFPTKGILGAALIVMLAIAIYYPSMKPYFPTKGPLPPNAYPQTPSFVLDDDILLTQNELIKQDSGLHDIWFTTRSIDYWPVSNTVLWLEWRKFDTARRLATLSTSKPDFSAPVYYRCFNMTLHVIESLLLWLILKKLRIPGAFFASLLFAVHPVNVESVAWIASLKNLLAMLFVQLSMLCYLQIEEKRENASVGGFSAWYALSLLFFVVAVLSKGSVTIFPALLTLIVMWRRPPRIMESLGLIPYVAAAGVSAIVCQFFFTMKDFNSDVFTPKGWFPMAPQTLYLVLVSFLPPAIIMATMCALKPRHWKEFTKLYPFFAVAIPLTLVNIWFQNHSWDAITKSTASERVFTAGNVAWFYIYKAFLPFNLAFFYPKWNVTTLNPIFFLYVIGAMISVVVTVAAAAAVFMPQLNGKLRSLAVAWLFFLVALFPVMGFKDVGFMQHGNVADRYQHIPIIAIVALVAYAWEEWRKRDSSYPVPVAGAAVLVLAIIAGEHASIFINADKLYRETLKVNPKCWLVRTNLADDRLMHERIDEAIEYYEGSLKDNPDFPVTHNNLSSALLKKGRVEDAIAHYKEALRLKEDYFDAQFNIGNVYLGQGQFDLSVKHLEKAVSLRPNSPDANFLLGNAYLRLGRLQSAKDALQKAVEYNPYHFEAWNNLGVAISQTDRPDRFLKALEAFTRSKDINPNYAEAWNNVGGMYDELHQYDDAIKALTKSIQLNPRFLRAYNNLALANAHSKRFEKACEAMGKAIELAKAEKDGQLAAVLERWLEKYRENMAKGDDSIPPNPFGAMQK